MNGYFPKINKQKIKKIIKKYKKLWSKIRDLISSKTKNSNDYDKKHMKIKFDSDDDLPPSFLR